jgi:hypothetical protein
MVRERDLDLCDRRANECHDAALAATDVLLRQQWLDLESQWMQLAVRTKPGSIGGAHRAPRADRIAPMDGSGD